MAGFPPDVVVVAQPWLARPRSELAAYGVPPLPRLIEVHATRSGVPWDGWPQRSLEFQATINWNKSATNRQVSAYGQVYGAASQVVISEQGQKATMWDKALWYPTYGAGFGEYGPPLGWAVDWLGISYELCQPLADMPFTDACLERAAVEIAADCKVFGIEPVRIPYLSQTEAIAVVSGLVGHEDTANGHKVGKTDPGPMFPWDAFIARVRDKMEDDVLTAQDKAWVLQFSGGRKLVKGSGPMIYIVTHVGKKPFPGGEAEFVTVYGAAWETVITVDDAVLDAIPTLA